MFNAEKGGKKPSDDKSKYTHRKAAERNIKNNYHEARELREDGKHTEHNSLLLMFHIQ